MITKPAWMYRTMAALMVAVLVAATGGATASAMTLPTSTKTTASLETEVPLLTEEEAQKFIEETGGSIELETGGSIGIAEVTAAPDGEFGPRFSVGIGWGLYLYLTPREQKAILEGSVAGLTAAICRNATATGFLGTAACVGVVGGALWAAKDWLIEHRVCPHRLEVKFNGPIYYKCIPK